MAVAPLDVAILTLIVIALTAYFTKGKLWGTGASEDVGAGGSSGSRDLVKTLNETGKKTLVLFGSQTGTAEDYAHKFAKEFQSRFGIATMCADLADYDYETFHQLATDVAGFRLVVFFTATYGEGDPTDNALDFFDYLDSECEDLSGLKFACFGLGNSTYEFYNATGRRTCKTLKSKNATQIGELGLGDDGQATMDEDYLAWKDKLFDTLKKALTLDEKEAKYEPGMTITEEPTLSVKDKQVALGEPDSLYVGDASDDTSATTTYGPTHPYLAPVTLSKELCPERHCIHAEVDLSGSNLKYITGDHLAIWPSNPDSKVEKFISALGLDDKTDTVISIKSLDPTVHVAIPSPTTYASVIRYYLEISGPVSRQLIDSMVQFAPNDTTKQKTKKVAGDKKLFQKEITDKCLDLSDALLSLSEGVKWTTVPFAFIVESIPHIQPRYYSISSSSLSDKTKAHVTVMVEARKLADSDKTVTGVCSNMMFDLEVKQNKVKDVKPFEDYALDGPRNKFAHFKIPVHVRRSTFKLPSNPETPIIMVGPGTGVAPFRGFVREKVKQQQLGTSTKGKIVLFYGCRKSSCDFLYKDEWTKYSKVLGDRFELITAFSREQEKKIYVQNRMLDHGKEIMELLKQGAFFYVCGDASKMARDVQKALVMIVAKENKLSTEDAEDIVKELKVQNRYQEDVW